MKKIIITFDEHGEGELRCVGFQAFRCLGLRGGIYNHEWPTIPTIAGNNGPTHGCIHLEIGNAEKVFNWVDQRPRLLIDYPC
ncbi:MAG: L,D-transpeptidase [Myxococcaceae bacterium]|nr:L,D-transpeptidase [Myxococcaceae bacterium]